MGAVPIPTGIEVNRPIRLLSIPRIYPSPFSGRAVRPERECSDRRVRNDGSKSLDVMIDKERSVTMGG
jgi:hypothetical protein